MLDCSCPRMVFEFINIYAYTEFFITWQDTVLVGFSCRSIIIKGRNTLILRISPLLHKFRKRRGMGLMAIVGHKPFGWTTGSRLRSCSCAGTDPARLSSLVKGARAGFEKPGEPWLHRLLTLSLQHSLCPTVLVPLTGGRYICREPVAAFLLLHH
jgi:hypothetical protein